MKLFKLNILTLLLAGALFISCKPAVVEREDVRKVSDVLLIMYVCCDANNGNNFFPSLQQAENALKQIRNEDGTAKEGFSNINIIALYDGASSTDPRTSSSSETRLLEIGAATDDYDPNTQSGLYNSNTKDTWLLSSNTKDLSSTVNWLKKNGRQEVNMSSYVTLTNFLTWVNGHYKADKKILAFCGHGAGVVAEKNAETKVSSRMIIFDDDTNGDKNYGLSTAGVTTALSKAGYYGNDKMDLIIEDLCLGASIEEIYGLKGYTKLFMASPEVTFGNSIGYYYFVQRFTKNADLVQICKDEISLDSEHSYAAKWPDIFLGDANYLNAEIYPCITLVDVTKEQELENIRTGVRNFSNTVHYGNNYGEVRRTFRDKNNGYTYGGTYYNLKDIGSFMKDYKDSVEYPELAESASLICDNLSKVIIHAHQVSRYSTGKENQQVTVNKVELDGENAGSETYQYSAENFYGISIAYRIKSKVSFNGRTIEYKDSNKFTEGSFWYAMLGEDY